jgi:adenylosuccinate lyase
MLIPAYENIALWHERDLTNSANERFIFSMSFILLDEMTYAMKNILAELVVLPENMKRNLAITGGLFISENVVKELVQRGLGRQEAHELVRKCSMKAITEKEAFSEVLAKEPQVSNLIPEKDISALLDYSKYLGATQELIDNALASTKAELTQY